MTSAQRPVSRRPRRQLPASAGAPRRRASNSARPSFRASDCAQPKTRRSATSCSFQEDVGLQGITDGEFRRTYFHIDFLEQLAGVETKGGIAVSFHSAQGNVDFAPPVMHVTGPVRHVKPIQVDDFNFLKSVTQRTPKVTIPSPTMLHFRGGRDAISRDAYPDLEAFYADVAAAYRAEIAALGAAGCRYLQLDDTNLAYLCDEKMRDGARQRGDDPDELPRRYARLINAAIAESAGGHDGLRSPVPRQFQERLGRRRRLRAGRRSAVQRARRRRLLPRIRRRALRRFRAAAARAARTRPSCSGSSRPSSASSSRRTI